MKLEDETQQTIATDIAGDSEIFAMLTRIDANSDILTSCRAVVVVLVVLGRTKFQQLAVGQQAFFSHVHE